MGSVPTVRVRDPKKPDDFLIVNASDREKYEEYDEEREASAPAAPSATYTRQELEKMSVVALERLADEQFDGVILSGTKAEKIETILELVRKSAKNSS